jgi:hypothetical protein
MKNKIKSSREQGQAIIEMCICLIPILVVLLGMIFISGLGISNIRAFIQAKGNAELSSRSLNAIGQDGSISGGDAQNIHSWNYGVYDSDNPFSIDEDGDGLAFTADDKINVFYDNDQSGTGALINDQLNNRSYSTENTNNYNFMPISELQFLKPNMDSDFLKNLPETMLAAAELVEGKANFNNIFSSNSNNANEDGIRSFKLGFTHLFGIEIDEIDLQEMRANKVYYPALPTSSAGSDGLD